MNKKYICPICGNNTLDEEPYDKNGIGTWEMCKCCSFETGMFCETPTSIDIFKQYRNIWLEKLTATQYVDDKLVKQINHIKGWMFEKNIKHSSYGEFQYCKKNLPIKELVDSQNIENWKDDSLFIEYATPIGDIFFKYYLPLLNDAHLENNKLGFDDFGINYYNQEQTLELYNKIKDNKNLPDRTTLLRWLKVAIEKYNGFYFLGD